MGQEKLHTGSPAAVHFNRTSAVGKLNPGAGRGLPRCPRGSPYTESLRSRIASPVSTTLNPPAVWACVRAVPVSTMAIPAAIHSQLVKRRRSSASLGMVVPRHRGAKKDARQPNVPSPFWNPIRRRPLLRSTAILPAHEFAGKIENTVFRARVSIRVGLGARLRTARLRTARLARSLARMGLIPLAVNAGRPEHGLPASAKLPATIRGLTSHNIGSQLRFIPSAPGWSRVIQPEAGRLLNLQRCAGVLHGHLEPPNAAVRGIACAFSPRW